MRTYTIILDETIAGFFEEIAIIVNRPVEDILSDGLFKQVEIIKRNVSEAFNIGHE